ncbi:Aste57867_15734 [Aphanomyces stellatus]|uniref:Aste57867_15734 protein n=1 Tax=Aphanomyces stellatus TaxID=120398 RepID=A0A485L5N3_9STRA|nr:hypothetical protein As57867_015678 [Aphanomyces stellatus]VFT92523.1 Aste57867_15734 [Aphanomyces stellatus]
MQRVGVPVCRSDIIKKASTVAKRMGCRPLGRGWYQRFMKRHPHLAPRTAQLVSRARDNVNVEGLRSLFFTMTQLVIKHKVVAAQVYNMDETSFESKTSTRRVVGLRGSSNVWTQTPRLNFHLTIIVAACADGTVTPPCFVLPGKSVQRDILADCATPDAAVTCAPKGFVNQYVFNNWLKHFARSVPSSTPRPLVLVCDGCSSHFTDGTYEIARDNHILIVCLPANATHLVQPLDVAVFKPYKTRIRELVHDRMINTNAFSLSKRVAINIAASAFVDTIGKKRTNIISGFRSTGLFPPSLPLMYARLAKFDKNATEDLKMETWLKCKEEIRSEVLVLPTTKEKIPGRKTVDTKFCLFTREALETIKQAKRKVAKKTSSATDDLSLPFVEEVIV